MSYITRNLLIVEDNQDWCESYVRAANLESMGAIRIAQDLAQAQALIDEMQFAVAFIDIGLNVTDDRNVDGIQVMEKIRTSGDPTSIVVVTGRSGRDVLPITRDAIKKYGALDIIGKSDVVPQDLRRLLREGVAEFSRGMADQGPSPEDALRGSVARPFWDDKMLRTTAVRGGIQGLHVFLEWLLAEFLPLVGPDVSDPVTADSERGFVHGTYWSRAVGRPVVVFFGGRPARDEIDVAKSSGLLVGQLRVGAVLKKTTAHGLTGAVFALEDTPRGAFGDLSQQQDRSLKNRRDN